ncbi:MAG: DUF3108 domain-containing protein [candidate division Zixibacteria bacterium]
MPKLTQGISPLGRIVFGLLMLIGLLPLLSFFSLQVGIAEATADLIPDSTGTGLFDRYVENVAFGVGEKLEFEINYGFINAGSATMEVIRLVEYESRPCFQIVTRAESNDFFSTIYRVDDRIESIMDALGMFSWRFDKRLREGKYRSDRKYSFDQRSHSTVYKDDTISIEPYVQDAISSMYFVRTQDLEVGKSVSVPTFMDGKKYSLKVNVIKREQVTVDAGTFDCVVVEPLSSGVGVFRNKGKMTLWLTDDRLKMPVLMKSKVAVGSITAELTNYTLGELSEI